MAGSREAEVLTEECVVRGRKKRAQLLMRTDICRVEELWFALGPNRLWRALNSEKLCHIAQAPLP